MENRKVKGWKLVKEEYEEAAVKIVQKERDTSACRATTFKGMSCVSPEEGVDFDNNSLAFEALKKAGVLDLWFKPVYEEPKLISGWYTFDDDDDNKWLMYYDYENDKRYGIDGYGNWYQDERAKELNHKDKISAITSRIQTALEKEAVKRGFKEGVDIESMIHIGSNSTIGCYIGYKFNNSINELWMGGSCIFKDGKWATIIEETLPVIEGYTPEDKGRMINWGCYTAFKIDLRTLKNMGITSFCLIHEGKKIKVSKEQTKQIFKYISE